MQKLLAVILSVLALTMSADSEPVRKQHVLFIYILMLADILSVLALAFIV